jgi:formamidopyrimidine-DNA glycosylase
MPELPEVETICRSLRRLLIGQRIIEVEVRQPRLRVAIDDRFPFELQGRRVVDIRRRGKYILALLEGERVWISHLGMSGKWIYVEAGEPRARHDHIFVRFGNDFELRYHDPRRFGLSVVVRTGELSLCPYVRDLGPDPLDPQFRSGHLYALARRSRRRIRDFLLDQTVVAGLGNIYINEILFRAAVRPTVRAFRLGRRRAERVAAVMPEVLREALRWRGTSISDYRDGENRKGAFQKRLRVYDREGEDCVICGSSIKKIRIGNRGAFYCPSCQS